MRYTSIRHDGKNNYQSDFADRVKSGVYAVLTAFTQEQIRYNSQWAHLFEESTGHKIASYTAQNGLSVCSELEDENHALPDLGAVFNMSRFHPEAEEDEAFYGNMTPQEYEDCILPTKRMGIRAYTTGGGSIPALIPVFVSKEFAQLSIDDRQARIKQQQ